MLQSLMAATMFVVGMFNAVAFGTDRFSKVLEALPSSTGEKFIADATENAKLRVVCFLGCECPLANLYSLRLDELLNRYRTLGVSVVGVNSNPQDSLNDIAKFVEKNSISFPILKDMDQTALTVFDAKRTPEVIVLDAKGSIVYRGRIDDQYQPGFARSKPNREDLRIAIEEYLSGEAVSIPRTESVGCLVTRRKEPRKDATVTFTKQIFQVLQRNCIECHRQGEIGPFPLIEYDEVVGWSDMMLETIEQHRMPPWHADPAHGDFLNARHMTDEDRTLVRQWIEFGMPYGNADELPTIEARAVPFPTSPKADLEIAMGDKPFEVAPEGKIEYQYFVVDPKFEEDRWVCHAELIPSNRSVVHHGIAFVRPPDGVVLNGIGWLTAYVPGQTMVSPLKTLARRVPAGSKIVFQMHYTPNGKPEKDLSRLRLTFADESEVTEELVSVACLNQELEIPPGKSDVLVESVATDFPQDGKLLAMSPHMHLRGKSMRVQSIIGDDRRILLDVPHYDFNWQHTYILRKPQPVKSLGSVRFIATYDNSAKNPFNPDPSAFVTWGDQTWEEMAIVFFDIAVPRVPNLKQLASTPKEPSMPPVDESRHATSVVVTDRHRADVDRLFKDLDRDGNNEIEYEEVEQVVQLRSFFGTTLIVIE